MVVAVVGYILVRPVRWDRQAYPEKHSSHKYTAHIHEIHNTTHMQCITSTGDNDLYGELIGVDGYAYKLL